MPIRFFNDNRNYLWAIPTIAMMADGIWHDSQQIANTLKWLSEVLGGS
jgi:hypothetical protein